MSSRYNCPLFSALAGVVTAVACGAFSPRALAQGVPQAPTTVQLPTFSFFTVQTAVSVPDRGGAYLGGLGRARDGSSTRGFGPLRSRASGREVGASSVSVHATIIDLRELDEAILAEAATVRNGAAPARSAERRAELLGRHIGRGSVPPAVTSLPAPVFSEEEARGAAAVPLPNSVAAIRAQNAAAREERALEAANFFALGQKAEADNKPGVAKAYYKMVIKRNSGQIGAKARERLASLEKTEEKKEAVAAR
jgi:hypothetical protein